MYFERVFAMPNAETFSIPPIAKFVQAFIVQARVSVDPFARDKQWATYTNDLNPGTSAASHEDAEAFCQRLARAGVRADLGIFDPPYSPRQIAECYKSIGLKVGVEETQNARLYKRVRDALDILISPGGVVLSFGWSSNGMGNAAMKYWVSCWWRMGERTTIRFAWPSKSNNISIRAPKTQAHCADCVLAC